MPARYGAGPQSFMEAPAEKPPFAWQPFTPRGVAAFAQVSAGRLFAIQFAVALLAAATIVWAIHSVWFPVVTAAIKNLPDEGRIRSGVLVWRGDNPATLAEGRCLAFTLDLKHQARVRSPAHIQVEFGERTFRIFSLFGFVQREYPRDLDFPFNQPELVPWWGAWAPPILGLVAGAVIAGLLIFWAILASLYSLPVWFIAFFADRNLTWWGAWRVAGAALIPGAMLIIVAVLFYALGTLGPVELFAAWVLHWIIGWIYAWLGALRAPKRASNPAAGGNPFT